jgi:D-aminoacyl-tRNA deacylase
MRIVIQRVKDCSVFIENRKHASIGYGILVLLGIEEVDNEQDLDWLVKKLVQLRIFPDKNGVMNLSIQECSGEIMVVSQFTLHALTKKGNRPSYIKAARPEVAVPLYELFIDSLKNIYNSEKISSGIFGAMMDVHLVNNGPVTIIIDSKEKDF